MTTLDLEFRFVQIRHGARRAWCLLAHRDLGPTNYPPQQVCRVCGMWRFPAEATVVRRRALAVVALLLVALVATACGDLPTAPTTSDPVIVDDGGFQAKGSGEFGGGGSRVN